MAGENIQTVVQSGESLSLYANMYNVKIDDIKAANNIKGEKINIGSKIVIPIGKKQEAEDVETDYTKLNYYGEKLYSWDKELQEKRDALYNPDLTIEERENLEAEFIRLQNENRKRKAAADVSFSDDKKHVTIDVKSSMEAQELRELFNIETGALRDFIQANHRNVYKTGKGFIYNEAMIYSGDKITIPTDEFNDLGFLKENAHRIGLYD